MMQELSNPQPGGFLVLQHLAHTVLVHALRLHLSNAQVSGQSDWVNETGPKPPNIPDWFAALSDKQIATAIACLHEDPAHLWTLKELARHAGMSR